MPSIDDPPSVPRPKRLSFQPQLILRGLAFAAIICAVVAFTYLFSGLGPNASVHAAPHRPTEAGSAAPARGVAVRDKEGWAADESASGTRPDASH